jgi:hypothetical protein
MNHKGYKCYNIENRKIYISRHVIFYNEVFPFKVLQKSTNSDKTQKLDESVWLQIPRHLCNRYGSDKYFNIDSASHVSECNKNSVHNPVHNQN